jgi:hypothetical protein
MPAGRPSTYTDEVIQKAYDYIDNYSSKYGDEIPSVVGLSIVLERARDTMYAWRDDVEKPEFSDILDIVNAVQQKVLLNKGLNGQFNSNMTKLVLGKHGFHEKQDVGLTTPEGVNFNLNFGSKGDE